MQLAYEVNNKSQLTKTGKKILSQPNWLHFYYFCAMRVISLKTLRLFWEKEPHAEQSLKSWYDEAEKATWKSPNELKQQYVNASLLSDKRVVFNIHGNAYRLIVDIEYRLQIIFIVWTGTHAQYDVIDAKTVSYVKTD